MSLRKKKYMVFAVVLGIPALLVLAGVGLEGLGIDFWAECTAAAVLAVFVGALLHLWWMRCPHCGRYLERNDGFYCQHCGKKIDWDAKP